MVTQRASRSMMPVYICVSARPHTMLRARRRPNIFLVSTVRQLVCGSSRNLNPMILGSDPSRVPNLRRGLPLAGWL